MIEHTYIEFMGLELADPLTFISDILMAAFCAYFGHKLFYEFNSKYAKLTAFFFLFLGFSAFLGGTAHLLDLYLGKNPHLIAWTMQGVSILFFQLASLRLIDSAKIKVFLKGLIFAFFGIFLFQVFTVQHFDVVKMNSIVGLIGFVSIIHLLQYFQERDIAYLRIPLAIALFAVPAMIHGFNIYLNKWIDQNVISHLLLLPCYYLLYSTLKQVAIIKTKTQPIPQSVPLEER
ncbi:hypothetical protein QYS49_10090 [Marivirga salinae]|uniref:Uncharacterized protein n=1 Tax=Marivirga salinarum TaxID=3059078 RepID=A0AA49GHD5_9BACT|nr:hypothetical protein [Marivirga sp. BDSF4-3]WKK77468.1 hypothetical protein QYS49_10090 [Marivirga sp. BDSF4-3]